MKHSLVRTLFLLFLMSFVLSRAEAQSTDIPVVLFDRLGDGGPIVDNLQLLVNFDQMYFNADKPIILRLAVLNTSPTPFTLFEDGFGQDLFQVTITDAEGKPAPLTRWGRTLASPKQTRPESTVPLRLVGQQVRYYQILLNREYDLTRVGTYRVTVTRPYLYVNYRQVIQLRSKPIMFTVSDPDAGVTAPRSEIIVGRGGQSYVGPIVHVN